MYRLERMCHSWPPDCQSWSPFTYASTEADSAGFSPLSAKSGPSSVSAVFSNCWRREVSRSLTASAASCVVHSRNRSSTRTPLLSSPSSSTSRWYEKRSLRRWTPSEKASVSTRRGREYATASGTSARAAYSISPADQGAPPTLRRISMYSSGLETRPALMLDSSHIDSLSRFSVERAKRRRQSSDMAGTVRAQRSASPASTGFSGSGNPSARSIGMNAGSRSRYAFAPSRSCVRLNSSRKWSSKKKTHTYQSVTSDSAGPSQSGCVYAQSNA